MNIIKRIIYFFKGNYKDNNGYWRTKEGWLIHRQKAYETYLEKREEYPLPYQHYLVLHKDKDKENNKRDNLIILTRQEIEYTQKKRGNYTAPLKITFLKPEEEQ